MKEEAEQRKAQEAQQEMSKAESALMKQAEVEAKARGETVDSEWRKRYREQAKQKLEEEKLLAEAQQHKHKGPGGARNKGGRKLVKQTSNPGEPRKKSAASSLAANVSTRGAAGAAGEAGGARLEGGAVARAIEAGATLERERVLHGRQTHIRVEDVLGSNPAAERRGQLVRERASRGEGGGAERRARVGADG